MSKQDRQGVRTPADLERKYDLGSMGEQSKKYSEQLSQLNQLFSQFATTTNAKIKELEEKLNEPVLVFYPVGSIYISVNANNPSSLFGGEWELFAEGYLNFGSEAGNEEVVEPSQTPDSCYLWKRIA